LDKEEMFAKGMARLQLSKNSIFSEDHMTVYFDILKDLEYIDETFNIAMRRTFFKGLPTASELLDIHQELADIKKQEEIKQIEASTPKLQHREYFDKETTRDGLNMLSAAISLHGETDLTPDQLYEEIKRNKDLIPKDYHKNRDSESINNIFKNLLKKVTS
jgi:predicted nuclease with TOPRIM domain